MEHCDKLHSFAGSGWLNFNVIRYGTEVKPADKFFDCISDLKLDREMVEIAGQIIERKSAGFDPCAFQDRYAEALKELVAEKAISAERHRHRSVGGAQPDLETKGKAAQLVR